jgi:hypothetical protein
MLRPSLVLADLWARAFLRGLKFRRDQALAYPAAGMLARIAIATFAGVVMRPPPALPRIFLAPQEGMF